jgi:hypothetical protein
MIGGRWSALAGIGPDLRAQLRTYVEQLAAEGRAGDVHPRRRAHHQLGPLAALSRRRVERGRARRRACNLTLVVQQAATVDEALRCIGMLGGPSVFSRIANARSKSGHGMQ